MDQNSTPVIPAPVAGDNEYRQRRLEHMKALEERGYPPFGSRFNRDGLISAVRASRPDLLAEAAAIKESQAASSAAEAAKPEADDRARAAADKASAEAKAALVEAAEAAAAAARNTPPDGDAAAPALCRVAGRVLALRDMGKTIFVDLRDGTGRIQLFVNKKQMGDEPFDAFKLVDIGDHVGAEGEFFVTRTGELSVRVNRWTMLSKALLQPPEKFHGLVDQEERYRKRYVDLFTNPESRRRFDTRIAIVRELRRYLEGLGYQEVETPMMQPQAGGAAARPFITHYNALDCDMFMRIAPELYLKRLIVGGFDKVFELNRDFRNEGLDRTHNPEFTVLEVYAAYGDRLTMKDLVEGMFDHLCKTVLHTYEVEYGEAKEILNFKPPFREAAYSDLVREKMGADWFDLPLDAARERARTAGLDEIDPAWDMLLLTHEVYDKLIEKTLRQPTFVTRIPRQFVPLAKRCADDDSLVDVFEFVVGGKELCPGYSEQNNPLVQRAAFEDQAGEDPEKIDEDFIAALEYGMPPTGGLGMGIDRLVMMLTGTEVIRDVILFPQLKKLS